MTVRLTQSARPADTGGPARVPSETWRTLAYRSMPLERVPRGIDATWNAMAGRLAALRGGAGHYLARARVVLERTKRLAEKTDADVQIAAAAMHERLRLGRLRPDDLVTAYAIVCTASVRTLGLLPHREQVAAALAIHDGCVVEMATGEGKTLSATMPAVVAGWRGRGCHVLTSNSYLAARDAETMTPIYAFCGLRAAALEPDMQPADRREAYAADITYGTNQDVAADLLRDRLTLGGARSVAAMLAGLIDGRERGARGLVMRGLDTAIVDEADSIFIDESVTPLIISGDAPNADQVEAYADAAEFARGFDRGVDFRLDRRDGRRVWLTPAGRARLERLVAGRGGLWTGRRRREELVTQALTARELFLRGQQYVVEDDKVVIVDESTGRLMPDRTWRAGLHQAVEAKESLEINPPKDTLARISFQRFFRMYRHLGGMTGTAWEGRGELWQIYGLRTVVLPTHRPCLREMTPDRLFVDGAAKERALLEEIERVHATGRPILVGTRSVDASETLGRALAERGIDHDVLNAVRHADEASIVARAGERDRVTVATNMAGRGTDIKLGPGVPELGGLHVIATERHESSRIDRQLFGRSARQGDPGSAVAFVALDDDLIVRYAPPMLRRAARSAPGDAATRRLVEKAQQRAQRLAARQRQALLRTDDWLDRFLGFAGSDG